MYKTTSQRDEINAIKGKVLALEGELARADFFGPHAEVKWLRAVVSDLEVRLPKAEARAELAIQICNDLAKQVRELKAGKL